MLLQISIHGVSHGPCAQCPMKPFADEIFNHGSLDDQLMPESIETFDFAPNHEFANLPLDGEG